MNYPALLKDILDRIGQGQVRAALSVNVEMLALYWDVGRMIAARQDEEGWGAAVIPRLAQDIRNDLVDVKGFSERNLRRMVSFYREYSDLPIRPALLAELDSNKDAIWPTPVAKLTGEPTKEMSGNICSLVLQLPWAHNAALLTVKNREERVWYMRQAISDGWSYTTLCEHIRTNLFLRQGTAVSNFDLRLPEPQSSLAQETLKNPYVFDFITLDTTFREKELEDALIADVEKFLLELGAGFAYMGRQYHLAVGDEDFYIDLLFYHTKLHCYVVTTS